MRARIIKSTGIWYKVLSDKQEEIQARIKGAMRLDELKTTNPVAVGDYVRLEQENGDWMIAEIEKRHNYILRKSPAKKVHSHILASNIDQAFVLVTSSKPRTSTGFIDRFLITAEAYHIPSILIFNKQDVLSEKDKIIQEKYLKIYEDIGYECHLVSSITGAGVSELKALMANKTTLLIGHSGVGKSTLANAIDKDLNLKTGEVSAKHEKGKHTTTFAEMFTLKFGGSVIDIPGIKEFGVFGFEKEEISHYFPEMRNLLPECKFNNCKHINEPQCAVLKGLESGEVSEERYKNYLNILFEIEEEKTY
ncbi:MAG: ribosome small subunit-dependent GTPase A [Chitinophagales bacterium]|nr:ribosome small subunit-dependent GTPase A [Chitinophagales bacterium]